MIRDPSDGSVKEKPTGGEGEKMPPISQKPPVESGLPFGSTKPENIAKLERSRRQLENYRKTGLFQSTAEVAEPELRSPEQGEG